MSLERERRERRQQEHFARSRTAPAGAGASSAELQPRGGGTGAGFLPAATYAQLAAVHAAGLVGLAGLVAWQVSDVERATTRCLTLSGEPVYKRPEASLYSAAAFCVICYFLAAVGVAGLGAYVVRCARKIPFPLACALLPLALSPAFGAPVALAGANNVAAIVYVVALNFVLGLVGRNASRARLRAATCAMGAAVQLVWYLMEAVQDFDCADDRDILESAVTSTAGLLVTMWSVRALLYTMRYESGDYFDGYLVEVGRVLSRSKAEPAAPQDSAAPPLPDSERSVPLAARGSTDGQ